MPRAHNDRVSGKEHTLGSALFNRMIADAGRGAGVGPGTVWLMGCCSSTQHIISALVCHVKYKHVEVSEAAPTPLYGA